MQNKTKVNALLVRHTQTNWNNENRYSGQSDIPTLTGKGLMQAFLLAQRLAKYPVTQIIASDLRRARDTALILASPHGLIPIIESRLREVGLGKMDGLLKEEAKAKYNGENFSTRSPIFDFSKIGGESRTQVVGRHKSVFDQYALPEGKGVSVFVGHGTSLRIFLKSLGQEFKADQGDYVAIWY